MNAQYTKKTFLLPVFLILLLFFVVMGLWKGLEYFKTEVKIYGGSIKEGIVGSPRFINPVLAQSQADHDLTRLLFTPLIEINEQKEIEYLLAKDIQASEDKKEYTLTLRENIFFEDKTAITTKDLAYTIELIQDPLIKSPLGPKWQGVQTNIVDQKTIVFSLSEPFADFIYNFELGILPAHLWANIDSQEFIFSNRNTQATSSGPYTIKDIETNKDGVPSRYNLVHNKSGYENSYLKKISILFFENEELLLKALQDKIIDAAYGIDPLSADQFSETHVVHSGSLPRVFALFFNQNKQEILRSKNIRTAIMYSIDKQQITEQVFNGYASPIHSPLGVQEGADNYSPQRARALVSQDGWSIDPSTGIYQKTINGKTTPLSFDIAIPNIEEMDMIANIIKDQLRENGIQVNIKSYDQGNLNQNIIRPREYQSLLFGYEIEKPSDLYAFWHSSQISDPGLNVSIFSDRSIDADLAQLRQSPMRSPEQIAKSITEEVPAVFIYSPSYIYVLPKKLHTTQLKISKSSDRFNDIARWYTRTRKVWPFLTNK